MYIYNICIYIYIYIYMYNAITNKKIKVLYNFFNLKT